MQSADRADFCVGYFNLRGWRLLQEDIDQLAGSNGGYCRILIGMNTTPRDELREYRSLRTRKPVYQQLVLRRKRQIVEDFRRQLAFGAPSNEDEQGLRDLVCQLRSGKVSGEAILAVSATRQALSDTSLGYGRANSGLSGQQQSDSGWTIQAR